MRSLLCKTSEDGGFEFLLPLRFLNTVSIKVLVWASLLNFLLKLVFILLYSFLRWTAYILQKGSCHWSSDYNATVKSL